MKFAVIGHPIKHSLSPIMHQANFDASARTDTYEALNIPPKHFHLIKEIMAEKEIDGFNITIPHKERIIPYLDEMDAHAKTIGAINTVKIVDGKWVGYNTDGIGYVKGLKRVYPQLKDARILLIGAGGASKGLAAALNEIAEHSLSVANRTMSRFDNWDLKVNTLSLQEAEKQLGDFDIVINTTPAGMSDNQDVVISLDHLAPDTLVSDIVYIPYKTPILKLAEAKGNRIYNGLDMFVNQGAESFKIWTGETADIKAMKTAVLKQLQRRD
ncbi:shikimate dehydrogenase [Staphylococcus condimenti]|uniref:Shikimate dehydrogenase (NADP(+)) n=1 Tax=Staphylococcus condimenti TaxID=70255 RepID=A0A143P817_9STAP|nr:MULTISPECIES: shikimate dehydrogenase [Staphylococcus]AMY04642.1 shikimate dehydrogenase [Staphylococcus condimenti]APR60880.1 shikimate dehydrogenase [Staphylococcus condimenti]MDK8644669.1 shikimate dehydrogenase [Staphylococcus condimenti]OFO99023.1 shikimate dehydrogenase [Staphylococcus sp. HMSC065E08]PNZ61307.1 shikimate dehydrogenase [Staphylococcus condimenti]